MQQNKIQFISESVEQKVNSALTLAFSTCPLLRWIYPEPDQYILQFPNFVKYYCGEAYLCGSGAFVENGTKGALLWQREDEHVDFNELKSFLTGSATEHRRDDVIRLFEKFNDYHPTGPYWYMTVIGTDPAFQRQGVGSDLLQYWLRLCDQKQMTTYCEATSLPAVRLYERMGWTVLDSVSMADSPAFYPMIRHPK